MKKLVIIAVLALVAAMIVAEVNAGNTMQQIENDMRQIKSDIEKIDIEIEEMNNRIYFIDQEIDKMNDRIADDYAEESNEFAGVKYLAFSDGSYMFAYDDEAARTTNYYFSKNGYSFERDWD